MRRPFAALLILLAGCSLQEPLPEIPTPDPAPGTVPGEAVVLLSEEKADRFDVTDFPAVADALGIRSAERVFPEAGEYEARHRAAGLHRWYRIRYDRSVPATKAEQDLGAIDGVEAVEIPRRKVRREQRKSFFSDPHAYLQWHLANDGSLGNAFKTGIDIHVEPVWEHYTAGSQDVTVAVIDGGADLRHEDLGGVILPAGDEGSRNFVAGYSPLQIPADDHGTHVAGIIGAVNGNGIGLSSVAGGKDGRGGVRLMSCVIFAGTEEDPEGGDSEEDAQALVWAADHGAVIANNSWGYQFDSEEDAARGAREFLERPSATKSAIDYFIDHAGTDTSGRQTGPMKGGIVLFAAGNSGWAHDAPSEYERVIAVGAFGPDGKMPLYANYGPWVDILAPGGSDADTAGEWILSCVPDDHSGDLPYAYMSGTSMACPHVAGVAALLVSHFGGPGFTNADLRERLLAGARTGVIDLQGRSCGGGMLDAAGAFAFTPDPVDPDKPVIRFETDYAGDYRFRAHEQTTLTWRILGNERAQLPVSVETDCPGLSTSCSTSLAQLYLDALQAEPGSYTATIRVGDAGHKTVSFTILPNHAPQLVSPIADQILNAESAALLNIDLDACFSDPDGETLSYTVSLSEAGVAMERLSGGRLSFAPDGYGLTEVRVTASDARKSSCTATFRLLCRNAYQELDLYPNPVTDFLFVRPGSERTLDLALYNKAGACVYTQQGCAAGPFDPIRIDMTGLSGGTYTLFVGDRRYTVVRK